MNKQYEALINEIASAMALHKIAEEAYIAAAREYNKADKPGFLLSEKFKNAKTALKAESKKVSEAQFELHGKISEKWVALLGDQGDGVGFFVTHGSWSGVENRLTPGEFLVFDTKKEAQEFCASNPFKRLFYQGDALSGGTN